MNANFISGTKQSLSWLLILCVFFAVSAMARADESGKSKALAPSGTDVFETSLEGTWFVDRSLMKRFRTLLNDVQSVSGRIRKGTLPADEARGVIAGLRDELEEVRALIDQQKVLISPFEIVTQEVTDDFNLGAERLLVITGDRLKVVGWDEPFVRCSLVKKVFSSGGSQEERLAGIRVIHEHRKAADLVGKTDEELAAWRADFLEPAEGIEQTPDERREKEAFWNREFAPAERFPQFVGREVDILRVEGLTYSEGNRQISYEIDRPEGGGQVGSRWQRHADITVYVPKCRAVLLRGCQSSLDVSDLQSDLFLSAQGSQNRDYNGLFSVRRHSGALTAFNVPVDTIENVSGDVTITATSDMVNSGSRHSNGRWELTMPPARRLEISNLAGKLTAHLARSDLHVNGVTNVLDVVNEHGETHVLIASDMISGNHRIVTQSGTVHVRVGAKTELRQPVFLASGYGTVSTNLTRRELDDLHVTSKAAADGLRRSWRSVHSKSLSEDIATRMALHHRPDRILQNAARSPGLDVLSVAGVVEFTRESP